MQDAVSYSFKMVFIEILQGLNYFKCRHFYYYIKYTHYSLDYITAEIFTFLLFL